MLEEELKQYDICQIQDQRKNSKRKNVLGCGDKNITLNIIDGHYFIEERTNITKSFCIHKYLYGEDIPLSYQNRTYSKSKGWATDKREDRFLMSGALIRLLICIDKVNVKLNKPCVCFKPMTWNDFSTVQTCFHKDIKDVEDVDLHYNPEFCTRLMRKSFKTEKDEQTTYWYADFESDVSGEIHKPFMVCLQNSSGTKTKTFKGEDCAYEFLKFLPDKAIVYFHNLAYDLRMFCHKGEMQHMLQKGTKIMNSTLTFENKVLQFRDTLPILNCKLSQIPSMFNLNSGRKEVFPYKYYTLERLKENKGVIKECGKDEDKIWNDEDMKLFISNIDAIPNCRIDEEHFDMYVYAEFYCQQDVKILRLGFNKFCHDFTKEFRLSPLDHVSISSLANEVFRQRVYLPNGNLYEYSGVVQKFIQKAVYFYKYSALRIVFAGSGLCLGQSFVWELSRGWFPLRPPRIRAVFEETGPEDGLRSSGLSNGQSL
ncbi:hypothetical protein TVAG_431210 [Trichomonas vaginalis G3]|uniref:DNA-directed DNA polymerase n=1 Tax=Trichomonas vaginalis (strain ATCC PRA-98 / G3) TaxID=412133 RepID=A2EZF9_TRIV3|nr:hypothetical protein TVAG_431210 [Trichomonas vaginalis G3]|eukprot:XP_001330821.1 hypothetical protein [Trichomonas vaginalis G3]